MFSHLRHIYDPRERTLVGLADLGLAVVTLPARLAPRRTRVATANRILLLRLERIGDLLMTLGALESVRATWPHARVDLVVGSWNSDLARQLPWIDRVETLDAPWLMRNGEGSGLAKLLGRARAWRREHYDLVINLEGDIRSNLLMALSGAPHRIGFPMAGGGALLTEAVVHEAKSHTDENARRLVRAAAKRFDVAIVEPASN